MKKTRDYFGDGAAYFAFILRNVLRTWLPGAHFDGWYHDAISYPFSSGSRGPNEYLLWNPNIMFIHDEVSMKLETLVDMIMKDKPTSFRNSLHYKLVSDLLLQSGNREKN